MNAFKHGGSTAVLKAAKKQLAEYKRALLKLEPEEALLEHDLFFELLDEL